MFKKKFLLFFGVVIIVSFFSNLISTVDADFFIETDKFENLRVGNDYIVIVVNKDEKSHGRFAVETTGGDPGKKGDVNKPLIYSYPKPMTSYTTFRIDGEYYVFGGETGRRAGRDGKYGEVIEEVNIKDDQIITSFDLNGIKVTQTLSLVKSSITGLKDTAKIEYELENTTNQTKEVGTRIMLDTKLGDNDGAPFRTGKQKIDTDDLLLKDELPEVWRVFDSISSPEVIARGTFKAEEVTTPDRVYMSDWGSLADGVWDFDFNPGEPFYRRREPYALDSAIALYWTSQKFHPNETRRYATKYGLGEITMVPNIISMGVSSPTKVTFREAGDSFPVVAYIENTSEIIAEDVIAEIRLPEKFEVETKKHNLGDLESGSIAQLHWDIKNKTQDLPKSAGFEVFVTAENTDTNSVSREIKIICSSNTEIQIKIPDFKVK